MTNKRVIIHFLIGLCLNVLCYNAVEAASKSNTWEIFPGKAVRVIGKGNHLWALDVEQNRFLKWIDDEWALVTCSPTDIPEYTNAPAQIAAGGDGSLWVIHENDTSRYVGGRWKLTKGNLRMKTVTAVSADDAYAVVTNLSGRPFDKIYSWKNNSWKEFSQQLPCAVIESIAVGIDLDKWATCADVGTSNSKYLSYHLENDRWNLYTKSDIKLYHLAEQNAKRIVAADPPRTFVFYDGKVWKDLPSGPDPHFCMSPTVTTDAVYCTASENRIFKLSI